MLKTTKKSYQKTRICLFLVGIYGGVCFQLLADELTVERFLKQTPACWKAARNQFIDCQFKFVERRFKSSNGTVSPNSPPKFSLEGQIHHGKNYFCIDFILNDENRPITGHVLGNSFYIAHLMTRDDSSFQIELLKASNDGFPDKDAANIPVWHLESKLYPGFSFENGCLFDCFFQMETFFNSDRLYALTIIDAQSEIDQNGEEVVTFEVEMVPNDPASNIVLKLLPARNWSLLKFQRTHRLNTPTGVINFSSSTECFYSKDSFYPLKVHHEIKLGNSVQLRELHYDFIGKKRLTLDQCRLPAFGLVEPYGLVPSIFGLRFLYILVVPLVAIALYFFKRYAWK
jgi:hypothetical protein